MSRLHSRVSFMCLFLWWKVSATERERERNTGKSLFESAFSFLFALLSFPCRTHTLCFTEERMKDHQSVLVLRESLFTQGSVCREENRLCRRESRSSFSWWNSDTDDLRVNWKSLLSFFVPLPCITSDDWKSIVFISTLPCVVCWLYFVAELHSVVYVWLGSASLSRNFFLFCNTRWRK